MALLPLADAEAATLLASVPAEQRNECWWVVLRDGTPVAGDKGGGIMLLAALQLTRPLGRSLNALHLSRLVDVLDVFVANQRSRLGWFVPDGPAPRRYP